MAILGASGCDIRIFPDRVEKTGPINLLADECQAYRQMAELLGSAYPDFFPTVLGFEVFDETATLTLERVGETDLEQLILKGENFLGILAMAIDKLEKFHQLTISHDHQDSHLFLEELFKHWRFKLGQLDWPVDWLKGPESQADQLALEMMSSVCHRDLGTNNLVWDGEQIRFIDPHLILSGATMSKISKGATVRDWATLAVNLERRLLTADLRLLKEQLQSGIKMLEARAAKLISESWFTSRLWLINKAVVYTSRAACACQFCPASLQQQMADGARRFINTIRKEWE